MTSDKRTGQPKSNDRPFVRWQRITLTQLGIVNATVLSLATAALGFGLTQGSSVSGYDLCALRSGVVLLVASVVLAVWCALTRLSDFRKTMQIVRLEEKLCSDERCEECKENLARWKKQTRKLGKRTWCLLRWQLVTFAGGAVLLLVALFP